jgi:hypothetical protein
LLSETCVLDGPHLTHGNMPLSKLAQASVLLTSLREVPGSKIAFETVFFQILLSFTQSLKTNVGIVALNRPRPLPHSVSDDIS